MYLIRNFLLGVQGKLQKEGELNSCIVQHCESWSEQLRVLTDDRKLEVRVLALSHSDEKMDFFSKQKKDTNNNESNAERTFSGCKKFK